MQGPIAQALALTCVGNAFLHGRDVRGFWPDALVFRYTKECTFRIVQGDSDQLLAADPLAWFESLRGCAGLRLHNAPRPRLPGQTLAVEERMLVGFVGGGPAWLIEAVGAKASTLWRGYDRLGDRADPERKIWQTAYLKSGETTPQDFSVTPLALASSALAEDLTEIETLALTLRADNFAECFRTAHAALTGAPPAPNPFLDDFIRYAGFDDTQTRVLEAALSAWVFGGMGSWNDIGPPAEHEDAYNRLSENLFRTLNDAICALANSTYSPLATS